MQADCAGHLRSASISPRTPGVRHTVLGSLGGPPPLSRDGLGSPGRSLAMLGNRWALGWPGCGAFGEWPGICLVLRGLLVAK